MYSNGLRIADVEKYNREGFLATSVWTPKSAEPVELGQAMFRGQCVACHTVDGYRPMRKLLQGRDAKAVRLLLQTLHKPSEDSPYKKYMPPLVGTDEEIAYLAEYLTLLSKGTSGKVAAK